MPYLRRCFVCHIYLDPVEETSEAMVKGKGSKAGKMRIALWLCEKHGAWAERQLTMLRDARYAYNPWAKPKVETDA